MDDSKKCHPPPKVPYFFISAEKIRGYSLTRFGQFFFFSSRFWKKKSSCFFFQEKIASHSLTRETVDLQKKVKTGKIWHFVSNFSFFRCSFFFPKKFPKFCFFFSQEKITRHSLSRISGPEKKNQPRKKIQHFYSLSRFSPKSANFNLFRGNKKIRYLWVIAPDNFFDPDPGGVITPIMINPDLCGVLAATSAGSSHFDTISS